MRNFDRYKKNLAATKDIIFSYGQAVADIDRENNVVIVREEFINYSSTTSKHINYAARELGMSVQR
mgnify:FL=1|tara:strand:- start:142 stop:339 length:198 start_codon:yes stop_codon:yes gene_type:complete